MDKEHRWWSIPAQVGNDLSYSGYENVMKKVMPPALDSALDIFIPAPST